MTMVDVVHPRFPCDQNNAKERDRHVRNIHKLCGKVHALRMTLKRGKGSTELWGWAESVNTGTYRPTWRRTCTLTCFDSHDRIIGAWRLE
jgi:hypothetical protein